MTMPTAEMKQIVVDAAEQGAQLGAIDQRFVKMTELMLQNVGLELARNVEPGERFAFCIPVQVDNGAKVDPGAALLLEHRIVVAWTEGTFRPKPRSFAHRLRDVTDVESFTRKVGRVSAQLDAIAFEPDGYHREIVLYSEIASKRVGLMLSGALNGSVTFNWT